MPMLLPSKRLRHLLLVFLLLCFITTKARGGRSLRERDTKEEGSGISGVKSSSLLFENNKDKINNNSVFDPKQEVHELDTMDYTPAGKNPPIHN